MIGMPPATEDSKASATPAFFRQRGELQAVFGDHRLVGGDDADAAPQRRLGRLESRPIGAADQFDEKVDVIGGRERGRIVEKRHAAEVDATVAGAVARGDRRHDDLAAGAAGKRRLSPLQQPHKACANDAEAGDSDAQRFRHGFGSGRAKASAGTRAFCPIWPRRSGNAAAALSQAAAPHRSPPRSARDWRRRRRSRSRHRLHRGPAP